MSNLIDFRLTIQPTNKCNLNCTYCYQKHKGNIDLTFPPIKNVLDKFFAEDNNYFRGFLLPHYDTVTLDFIGGEATLNMPVIDQTVSYFIELCIKYKRWDYLRNFQIWLETNGTTYFKDDVQAFLRKHHQKIDLPITIDGSKSCHDACRKYYNGKGSWEDVAKAVRAYMSTYGREPNSKITISPDNVSTLFESIVAMHDLGYTTCRMSCVNEEVWTPEADAIFVEQLTKFFEWRKNNNIKFNMWPFCDLSNFEGCPEYGTCGTTGTMLTIDCKGDLYLCQRFTEINNFSEERPALSIGTAAEGISDEGIQFIHMLAEELPKTANNLSEECKNCACGKFCESCPAFSYEHYGTFSGLIKTNCAKNKASYEILKKYTEATTNNNNNQN